MDIRVYLNCIPVVFIHPEDYLLRLRIILRALRVLW